MEKSPSSDDETLAFPSSSEEQLLQKEGKRFLGVTLRPGISIPTLFCYFLNNFQVTQSLALLATGGTSILISP